MKIGKYTIFILVVLILVNPFKVLARTPDYGNDYSYTFIFEETFNNEDETKKSSSQLDENWLFGLGKADPFIDDLGRFRTGWITGANITSKKAFSNYKLEFEMSIVPGAANGFGIRIPEGIDGYLYGGGRAGMPGAEDLGVGISFDFANEIHPGKFIIAFNDMSKGMGQSPYIMEDHPQGYDMSVMSKYTVYDTGDLISFHVNDEPWATIKLSGLTGGKYTKAVVTLNHSGETKTMDVSVEPRGAFSFYGRLGTTYVDAIDVYGMSVQNPAAGDDTVVFGLIVFIILAACFLKKRIEI